MAALSCKVGSANAATRLASATSGSTKRALQLKSGAGDISVNRAAGDSQITTGSGALAIGSIDGAAVVKNSNGDTRIGEVTGDLRVKAANGRISVDQADAAVTVKTANGDVRLGEVARGAVVAETAAGTVEVGVRDGVAAWLDLNTRFGNVQNDLVASDLRTGRGPGRRTRLHLLGRHHRPPFLRERRRKGGA